MEQTHVVHYQSQNFLPKVIYSIPRQKTNLISIPKNLLENRAEVAEKQLEYMIKFATEKNNCRTNISLFYFDEIPKKKCGNCDNCLNNRDDGNITTFIAKAIETDHLSLVSLLNQSPFSRNDTIQEIRRMMDKGTIINNNGFITKNEN